MIPELGHFALIIALVLAFLQAVFPIYASFHTKRIAITRYYWITKPLSIGVTFFISLSFFSFACKSERSKSCNFSM